MRPTVQELRTLFSVNPDGSILWESPPKQHSDLRGKPAGSLLPNGAGKAYWAVQISGRKYKRSQIVFCLTHGRWPEGQIDHIDGNSLDDRPENIREATVTQNAWNHKKRKKRSPLPMGVRQSKYSNYVARISVNKQHLTIGTFKTADEAAAAYQDARRQHFGEFA